MQKNQKDQKDLRGLAVPIQHKRLPFDPEAAQFALNVDRRACSRVVPMEVLVLGLSRTGTISLRTALFELGYFDVYHGASYCNENPREAEMWIEALKGKFEGGQKFTRGDWDQLFGHCMMANSKLIAVTNKALSDVPCFAFADDLIAAYPEAKVILTVRDSAESWKSSMEQTIVPVAQKFDHPSPLGKFFGLFLPRSPLAVAGPMINKYTRNHDVPWDGLRIYEDHNAWVKRLVSPDKLLVYNVKEGWEPLCRFLGKDVPDKPFPRVNDGKAFSRTIAKLETNMGLIAIRNMALAFGIVVIASGIVIVGLRGRAS